MIYTIAIIATNKGSQLLRPHKNKILYSQQFYNDNFLPDPQQMQDLYCAP